MKDPESTGTTDQRHLTRQSLDAAVTMRLETTRLAGLGDNISRAGLLFFTEEPLRVTVEVEDAEGSRTFRGRLIRLQRMSESSTGLAVEFEPG